jgi:hypothetical protein
MMDYFPTVVAKTALVAITAPTVAAMKANRAVTNETFFYDSLSVHFFLLFFVTQYDCKK